MFSIIQYPQTWQWSSGLISVLWKITWLLWTIQVNKSNEDTVLRMDGGEIVGVKGNLSKKVQKNFCTNIKCESYLLWNLLIYFGICGCTITSSHKYPLFISISPVTNHPLSLSVHTELHILLEWSLLPQCPRHIALCTSKAIYTFVTANSRSRNVSPQNLRPKSD